MIQLNDDFLADVGLQDMPRGNRTPFLQTVYETLELRVGSLLSEGLSDDQLSEFSAIIDREPRTIVAWIEHYAPTYTDDPIFQRLSEGLGEKESASGIVCEYAATKWLEVNSPDYRDLVAAELGRISEEIRLRLPEIRATFDDGRAGESAVDACDHLVAQSLDEADRVGMTG
ncbi:MAG: hypothetical protein JST91_31235 [Actinobacteria bacterium]|nr:hypothetical protein [Actinomycetota bacterium]